MTTLQSSTFLHQSTTFSSSSIQEQHDLINYGRCYTNRIEQQLITTKLYSIKEAIVDRVEMHKNICEQRNQWLERENRDNLNGWNVKLEEEMRRITKILEKKDQEEYIRIGKKALNLNKFFAILSPILTGAATIGSACVGCSCSWAPMFSVVPGALASIVNIIQHGGQVGMIFEMYRSNAGFFKYMKESIESNLMEKDYDRRENGEVFEMKLALKLGRSLLELRDLANNSCSSCKIDELDEFASKLF